MALKKDMTSGIIIAGLTGSLLFAIFLFGMSLARSLKLKNEIKVRFDTINSFVAENRMPLTKEALQQLTDERNRLKSIYSRLKLALVTPLGEEIPQENIDPLQFKERLMQTQRKLREEAGSYSLSLPDSLGFTKYETELSTPTEIPALIRRLKILEELVYLLTLSGATSVTEINFTGEDVKREEAVKHEAKGGKTKGRDTAQRAKKAVDSETSAAFQDKRAEKKKPELISEVPISLEITCTYSGLVNFLYRLRTSPFIFIADDLDALRTKDEADKEEAQEGMVKARLLIKALIIN